MTNLRQAQASLVKKIKPDGSKTLYIAGLYEVDKNSTGTVTQTRTYYPAGGAMRINITGGSNTLYYILKDHLGSASVVTSDTGSWLGEQRYSPYGETRFTSGTIYTDKLFTGQRDTGLGIYDYGARFYSPKLGRFLSPDTIVPGAGNPQAFNRYSYVLGNPLKYTDPTGHRVACDEDDGDICEHDGPPPPPPCTTCGGGGGGGGGHDHDDKDEPIPPGWSTGVYCVTSGCYFDGVQNAEFWMDPLFYAEVLVVGAGSYNILVDLATINPEAGIVSIGSNGLYQKAGFTFFELPNLMYKAFNAVGLARLINISVMANQIAQEKPVIGSLVDPSKPGAGTELELKMLRAAQYVESTGTWLGIDKVNKFFQPSTWQWLP